MLMGGTAEPLTLTYTDWFHHDWYENHLGTKAKTTDAKTGEVEILYMGPVVEWFQYMVEQDYIVLWAESQYDVQIKSEYYYTDRSGKLQRGVCVEFTLVTDKYFRNIRE